MNLLCYSCGTKIPEINLGRQDSCDNCGRDTRVCKNCTHYDTNSHNECRESQTERQVDKEKSNFCDWFRARAGGLGENNASRDSLKNAAEALFKK